MSDKPEPTTTGSANPVLALDMTALWKRRTTGIQRVIREVTPHLARAAAANGWEVVLVRNVPQGLEVLARWTEDRGRVQVMHDLDRIAAGRKETEADWYVQFREHFRRTARWVRQTPAFRYCIRPVVRRLASFVPMTVKRRLASKLRSPSRICTAADAYLTFAAGILPARLPDRVPAGRAVFVIHDLIPLHHARYCEPQVVKNFVNNIGELAFHPGISQARIVTASEYMAADIKDLFHSLARKKVTVDLVEWGYDRHAFYPEPDPSFRQTYGIPADALLVAAVSTQDPRKRFADIQAAVARMNACAVFLGQGERRREGNAIYLGYVGDDVLRRAYSSSDVVVNWSAAEGFGLPTIEALACGGRVVVPPDNPTSIEVGGEHVIVAEQADIDSLCAAIQRAAKAPRPEPDLRRYDWRRCADSLANILWPTPPAIQASTAVTPEVCEAALVGCS